MALIKNAINFGNGFNIGAVGPIDARMRVQYLNDLTSAWTDSIPSYPGMIVTVMYDGTSGTTPLGHVYVLKNADATKLENWVKLSTATDSTASADEVLAKLNQEISARTEADKTINDDITTLNGKISGNTKSLEDLNDNFAEEVKERQTADAYFSGVTSGITEELKGYKIKSLNQHPFDGVKTLSVDENGVLNEEISLSYDKENKQIQLLGLGGETLISTIDATDFVKDGMLSGVTLQKEEGKPTYMVFTFNTGDSAQTISLDVEEFLNADEVAALERSLGQHKGDTTLHFTTDEKTKLTNLYSKDELDTKFSTINSALTANTQAHVDLSSEIASARTDIDTISGDVKTAKSDIASARTDIDTISGDVETAKSDISKLQEHVTSADTKFNSIDEEIANVRDEYSRNDMALANHISTISGDVKTLTEKVNENEEVVATALNDLKANKVSSLSVEEGSNIVINEVKDENGISYTIGFQWLEF